MWTGPVSGDGLSPYPGVLDAPPYGFRTGFGVQAVSLGRVLVFQRSLHFIGRPKRQARGGHPAP